MEFISDNNLGFGSYFSLFNSEGLLREHQIRPGFLFQQDTEIDVPLDKERVIYLNVKGVETDSVKGTNINTEYDSEIILLWLHIPIPFQKVDHASDKIFYNQHFSGLDLINKITVFNGAEIYKEYSRLTYKLELQQMLGSEYRNFHDKYLDLTKRLSYQHSIMNLNNSEIEQETLHFPIFFKPHLKPSLVDNSKNKQKKSKSNNFKIEFVLNDITKLFTKSKRVKLNPIILNLSRATIVSKCFNDLLITNDDEGNRVQIQTETVFQKTAAKVTNICGDHINPNGFKVEIGNIDLLTSNIFFAVNDISFDENKFFYGKTINESIKCYLNSCFKLICDTDTCVNLKTLEMSAKSLKGWSAQFIDSNHILISYTNAFDVKYETILISKKFSFAEMQDIYIDLNVSLVVNFYWFKKIELEFDNYDKFTHEVTNDSFNNGLKVINSQFMFRPTEKSENKSLYPIVFLGVEKFCFNYRIVAQWTMVKNDDKVHYLTKKHFDVYFSMPVHSDKPSFFAKLDFVILDYCDYHWMDLDRNYPWKINGISIVKQSDTNFLIKFEENTLCSMGYDQPFDIQMLSITSPGLTGYCNLNNYDLVVELNENEFFEIKKRDLLKMECIVSNFQFFKYHKQKYSKLKLNSIINLTESDEFQELLCEENKCKKKIKYN